MRVLQYVLDGHVPRQAEDLVEWATWMSKAGAARKVKTTTFDGKDIMVSTVFLGLDHDFGCLGTPILFETMVFGGPLDQAMERYSTWEQAELGHQEMVEKVARAIQ